MQKSTLGSQARRQNEDWIAGVFVLHQESWTDQMDSGILEARQTV